MKKIIILWVIGIISIQAQTQTILKQTGNYKIGEKTIYAKADMEQFDAGNSGSNVTWDFSKGFESKSVVIMNIKPIVGNKYQNKFKHANLVVDNGDSTYVFMEIKGDTNTVYGFVNEKNDMVIEYTKPYIAIIRPLKYKDSIYTVSERNYESYGFQYIGKGFNSYVADGYGTLITPNDKYPNVIRVKNIQDFTDQMTNSNGEMTIKMITYAWYDNIHKDAICRVYYMKIKSDYYNGEFKGIQYIQNNL